MILINTSYSIIRSVLCFSLGEDDRETKNWWNIFGCRRCLLLHTLHLSPRRMSSTFENNSSPRGAPNSWYLVTVVDWRLQLSIETGMWSCYFWLQSSIFLDAVMASFQLMFDFGVAGATTAISNASLCWHTRWPTPPFKLSCCWYFAVLDDYVFVCLGFIHNSSTSNIIPKSLSCIPNIIIKDQSTKVVLSPSLSPPHTRAKSDSSSPNRMLPVPPHRRNSYFYFVILALTIHTY